MSILCYNHGQVKMYNLTPYLFQSWLRKDFQSWPRKDFNPDSFKRRQDYFSQDFWRPRLPDN